MEEGKGGLETHPTEEFGVFWDAGVERAVLLKEGGEHFERWSGDFQSLVGLPVCETSVSAYFDGLDLGS